MQKRSYSTATKTLFREHRHDGKSLIWISDAMKISFNTLKRWSTKIAKGEDIEDKRSENGKQKTFSDEALSLYIKENVNATLKDIGDHFSVSDVAILKRLRKMDYSYKKKRGGTKKEMKGNEPFFKS